MQNERAPEASDVVSADMFPLSSSRTFLTQFIALKTQERQHLLPSITYVASPFTVTSTIRRV